MERWTTVVFDMDGTLYDLQDVFDMNYEMQLAFYRNETGLSAEKTKMIFAGNHILPYRTAGARSATEFFAGSGLSLERWQAYREQHFDVQRIQRSKAADARCLQEFAKAYHTVLLTSNSYRNVKRILAHVGIPIDCFHHILCSDHNYPAPVFTKKQAFSFIAETGGMAYSQMLSIGDRYQTDIAPLLELGGAGILLESPACLQLLYADLQQGMLRGIGYRYYGLGVAQQG